jgi:hypothetical protein
MNIQTAQALAPSPAAAARWRDDPKLELNLAWLVIVIFYNIFGIVFFVVTRTQPPPPAWWDAAQIGHWFHIRHTGLLAGFGAIFLISGFTAAPQALIAYSMRRMSISPAFAYSYLLIYALSAVPGLLLTCIFLVVGAMRPDRDPQVLMLIYDSGFLTFSGTMGLFMVGSVIWAVAILLDKNRVFPKWFGYFNICNALTEVVVATCWIAKSGPFAWDGVISYYINMVVFAAYTGVFITLLRTMIRREDFSSGILPD